jgi:hypothetical protein
MKCRGTVQYIIYQRKKCRCTKALSQQLEARLLVKERKQVLSAKLDNSGKAQGFTGFWLGTFIVL